MKSHFPSFWLYHADVNECLQGLHMCHYNQQCVNTVGAYRCQAKCGAGFKPSVTGSGCEGKWPFLQSMSARSEMVLRLINKSVIIKLLHPEKTWTCYTWKDGHYSFSKLSQKPCFVFTSCTVTINTHRNVANSYMGINRPHSNIERWSKETFIYFYSCYLYDSYSVVNMY